MVGKMFPFITQTWNPLGGECLHKCGVTATNPQGYCWATALKTKYPNLKNKYGGKPRIIDKEFNRIKAFKENDFIFVCDMTDLFGEWVSSELIQKILDAIQAGVKANSHTQYLLLTKNPKRYLEFTIPDNCVCGATIETDIDGWEVGAPPVSERISAMRKLNHQKMISIEPIMEFNIDCLSDEARAIMPDFVAVGYDNYNHGLDEPTLAKTNELIEELEHSDIKVYRKTLRKGNGEA